MIDVARRAHVSLATVSRVLNKTKHVDPDLELRVLKAVEELDYHPNQHARWLSSRKSNVVGLVIPSMEDSMLSDFLHAASESLRSQDYDLMVTLSDGEKGTELQLLTTLVQSHVSGVILATPVTDKKSRALLKSSGVPFLYAFTPDPTSKVPSIVFDDSGAARTLIQACLNSRNHSRTAGIVIVTGPAADSHTARRLHGFLQGMDQKGCDKPLTVESDGTVDGGYQAVNRIFQDLRPGLIVCTTDYMAIGAIRAAYEAGVRVPQDMYVLGFGENTYSHTCTPTVTTVRLDGRSIGQRCGAAIVQLMKGERPPALQQVGYELVPGESCPLARDAPDRPDRNDAPDLRGKGTNAHGDH